MSQENKKTLLEGLEDTELSNVEQEEFRLLDMQTRQAMVLERTGIAAKAREVVRQNHENMVYRLQHSDMAADLPAEPKALRAGSETRMAVVLMHDRERRGITAQLAVMFITSKLHEHGSSRDFSYAPVGTAQVQDTDLPQVEQFRPLETFTETDVKTVFDLLAEVNDARFLGELPHLRNDLARIDRPDTAIAKIPEVTG